MQFGIYGDNILESTDRFEGILWPFYDPGNLNKDTRTVQGKRKWLRQLKNQTLSNLIWNEGGPN